MSSQQTKPIDLIASSRKADGTFDRKPSVFRSSIEKGGKFEPEKGRYHLYVAYSCPWATRTLIVRKLKGLEEFIGVTVVSPHFGPESWPFAKADPFPGADNDPLYGASHIKDIYYRADPNYSGRFTVPVLWDKKTETIVNNESSEIIRFLNTAFNDVLPADKAELDLYPEHLRQEIDEINDWVYNTVNNGVYRAGFASTQKAYEDAVLPLFESLDRLEKILAAKDYLVGDQLTEADVRLFVTIIRFDVAYYAHFKCNLRTIRDGYPAIHLWLRKLYWNNPAFSETCNFDHIKGGYYSIGHLNPYGIVPVGPIPNILPL
ncbi:glutathione S-transferase [Dichomitus squalens LYAD-421 SS1]|uniref:Glutathione S-transferase n=1 Tax=Dichomitus squalens (strain LYAD-421) TaxID=732165 RepID=R7STB1_DICSQ|nr:glutathione S-transferase [Dichomitus squalens LYAD-421 SS1]EJF59296.1 glutathione S-transferase [Dichomitus squalens LYAD-421 SS1]